MTTEENHNEPLPEEIGSEITEGEPIDFNVRVLEPTEPVLEPDQERFEETMDTTDTTKVQEWKPQRQEKTMKEKRKRPGTTEPKSRSISKLHKELRKHSDARRKTELAVKDIEKQLKDLLLSHHSAIKDLQKQVNNMHRRIATIEPRKSTRSKTTAKKTTASKKRKKNKPIAKKNRKR